MSDETSSWSTSALTAVRKLSITALAGALAGLVVGGIGGRLAMFLLARLNPEATGVRSDDDFEIGQFTILGTLNLIAFATLIGVIGGAIYLGLRGLRMGPTWFRYASVAAGAGVVVGALIVHDGVDFTLLQPAGLAIALFVAIPVLYAVLLQWLAERWLDADSRLMTTSRWIVFLPAIAVLPLVPLWVGLGVGWTAVELVRRSDTPIAAKVGEIAPWLARLVLAAIFVAATANLVDDIKTFA